MIVSYSIIEDQGAGFRERLMAARWAVAKEKLSRVAFPRVSSIQAKIIIWRDVPKSQEVFGLEETAFAVHQQVPLEYFKSLTIREKNDLVLELIFASIRSAYAHFSEVMPPEIEGIYQEVMSAK